MSLSDSNAQNPTEIARIAIRQLAARRIAPTPENFAAAYAEAGGGRSAAAITSNTPAIRALVDDVRRLVGDSPHAPRLSTLESESAWTPALELIRKILTEKWANHDQHWPELMAKLIGQLEVQHEGWSSARKVAALNRVLADAKPGQRTSEKLEYLLASWGQAAKSSRTDAMPTAAPVATQSADNVKTAVGNSSLQISNENAGRTGANAWRELAILLLRVLKDIDGQSVDARFSGEIADVLATIEIQQSAPDSDFIERLGSICTSLQARLAREREMAQRLASLLRILCDNLALFSEEDGWVEGQAERIKNLLSGSLNDQALAEAEEGLRIAVTRQASIKSTLMEARTALREMLLKLIESLGVMVDSTGVYYESVGKHAVAIQSAKSLPDLAHVVSNLLSDTESIRSNVKQSHGELVQARDKAQAFEARVHALEAELAEVSSLVRTDPLTKVLNRRGLDVAYEAEQARLQRNGRPLTLALLDIDDFKKLNDTFGHDAGDKALQHIANLATSELRTTDSLARFGGEEFIILLPETPATAAVEILKRVQRQLTRALFLHNDEKVLITFSVGVTECKPGETQQDAMKRADAALYVAKSTGKNRTVVG